MKKMTNDSLGRATLLSGLCLGAALITLAPMAFSQTSAFFVSIEPPGVQNQVSPLVANGVNYGAAGVHEEDFNRFGQTAPTVQTEIFFENNPAVGVYSPSVTRSADQFGGAKETPYMTVNTTITSGAPAQTTITFGSEQRYFGLWWSAGDPHNELDFYKGNTLLFRKVTADVLNFLESDRVQPGLRSQYFGNPNPGFQGSNHTEPYAFLNFFADPLDPNVTFDKVVLTNDALTGFESDNHTIATAYTDVTGMEVPPGPGEPEPVIPESRDEEVDVGPGGEIVDPGSPDIGGDLDIDKGGELDTGGPTTVEPGGTVKGEGIIMTPDLINNGTVEPMGEEGTGTPGNLTVKGNYNQGPGGTLEIGIAGVQCPDGSRLVVTGTATLNGTLDLVSLNNFHATSGSHYTVLDAFQGVSGFFTNVTDTFNTSGLTRADIMAPNGVVVAYLPPGHGALTLRSAIPIPDNNPCDVDAVLLSALAPNAEQLSAPFDIWFQMAQTQRFNLEAHFDDIMAGTPLAPPPTVVGKEMVTGKEAKEVAPSLPPLASEKRWNLWGAGYGDFVNVDDEDAAKGYRYTTGGMTAGLDYRLTDQFVVGLIGGYAHTWTNLRPGSIDVDTGW